MKSGLATGSGIVNTEVITAPHAAWQGLNKCGDRRGGDVVACADVEVTGIREQCMW